MPLQSRLCGLLSKLGALFGIPFTRQHKAAPGSQKRAMVLTTPHIHIWRPPLYDAKQRGSNFRLIPRRTLLGQFENPCAGLGGPGHDDRDAGQDQERQGPHGGNPKATGPLQFIPQIAESYRGSNF